MRTCTYTPGMPRHTNHYPNSHMDRLSITQIRPLVELVGGLIRALERAGVDKIYVFAILLAIAIVLDSILITILVWVRYGLFLGLLTIPVNAALRWNTGTSTTIDKEIVQTIDRVYEIPGMLVDDSDDGNDDGSEKGGRETVLAGGPQAGGE